MVKNKEKQFDCIKMKRSIQKQIYAETKNMSVKEVLNYFNGNHNTNTAASGHIQTSKNRIIE
jgi:hypothetical protein